METTVTCNIDATLRNKMKLKLGEHKINILIRKIITNAGWDTCSCAFRCDTLAWCDIKVGEGYAVKDSESFFS